MGWLILKKIFIGLMIVWFFFLAGCSKGGATTENFVDGLIKYNTDLKSYYSEVLLEINKGEEVLKFDCEVYYLGPR